MKINEIRHWFIQKPITNNCPNKLNGAVFTEFLPTISEQNCEWIKVYSADDLHKFIGMGITRYVEVCQKAATLQAQVKRWESKEIKRASCCSDNEDKLGIAVKALEEISQNTYGTEICNTDEENNEILASHFFWHQGIARNNLALIREKGK